MPKRMLIDASHPEETRVVVTDGARLDEFDVETSTKKQLKGNIYLAKVVRVEPSLQAAFVEYGGGRHGFLAFGEIHPDYYQIPVADRQRLLELEAEEAREAEAAEEAEDAAAEAASPPAALEPAGAAEAAPDTAIAATPEILDEAATEKSPAATAADDGGLPPFVPEAPRTVPQPDPAIGSADAADDAPARTAAPAAEAPPPGPPAAATEEPPAEEPPAEEPPAEEPPAEEPPAEPAPPRAQPLAIPVESVSAPRDPDPAPVPALPPTDEAAPPPAAAEIIEVSPEPAPPPEQINAGAAEVHEEEPAPRRIPPKFLRNYKIQEVIKRRQILLVQVVKEERGNKGAALTTYLSLAGRYSVLMPNSPRGGGISRKITSAADRRRLREITAEMQIPRGMGLIVRTAGAQRPKAEIKRDCEYLLRLWDSIRETTLASTAPALIYEEASLIKRSIRDVYTRDVDEIVVEGDEAYRQAKDFMRMLMPSHARKVQPYRNGGVPLFVREKIENQLDAMHSPTVQLKSGGYLVINQAEALVAIDVNSGRSTRERGIEETALRTNLEAADEAARQLRLRDLAGLIVIDFIDMESARHNAAVERRLKEALKHDRARIQVGRISHFGLLEMSRQRLHPSLTEQAFVTCPHCAGTGLVRTTESAAMQVLRAIEEEGSKQRAAEILVTCASALALYLLNHKRERLAAIEAACGMRVVFAVDDSLNPPAHRIDRTRAATPPDIQAAAPPPPVPAAAPVPIEAEDEPDEEEDEEDEDEAEGTGAGAAEERDSGAEGENGRRRRRRRRRRGGRREDGSEGEASPPPAGPAAEAAAAPAGAEPGTAPEAAEAAEAGRAEAEAGEREEEAREEDGPRRRRGRRGGRRRRHEDGAPASPAAVTGGPSEGEMIAPDAPPAEPPPAPRWTGPTPADPFATAAEYDVFAAMEAAEEAEAAAAAAREVQPRAAADTPPRMPATTPAETLPAETPEASAAAAPPDLHPADLHPEPSPPAEPPAATAPPPEPAAPPPAEPATPALQPIIVTDAPADAPRRRGWWRR